MAKNKKRPLYVEEAVATTNVILRKNQSKGYDSLCDFIEHYLMIRDMYRGFNFFKDNEQGIPTLAAADDYDYIQYY